MKEKTEAKPVPKKIIAKPRKDGNKQLVIWILAGIAVLQLVGAGILLYFIPSKARNIQVTKSQQISSQMTDQDRTLLKQALEETAKDREVLKLVFPGQSQLLTFIKVVDQLRQDPALTISRFSVDSETPTKIGRNQAFLPLSLEIAGERYTVFTALQKIQQSPFLIRTVSFTQEALPDTNKVKVLIRFHLFVADTFHESKPKR